MEPSILKFAQMAGIFITMCAALAVIMLGFNVATRLVRRVSSQLPAPRFDDQRLARLEQAVDAIAIEVERVSESQRFISKLLGERSQESSRLLP
jgi:hypothetical protein